MHRVGAAGIDAPFVRPIGFIRLVELIPLIKSYQRLFG